uniref:mitogen-activated protein kinase kinase n=2 Tax=Timema TaxID=61471 RepID=A0A7R8VF78_TIMDO|nr:unnamed protein product [Timema douglasi]
MYSEQRKKKKRRVGTEQMVCGPIHVYDFTSEDLNDLGEIGRGAFGTVNKMVHRHSNTVMAVKIDVRQKNCIVNSVNKNSSSKLVREGGHCVTCDSSRYTKFVLTEQGFVYGQRIRSTVDEKEQKQLLMDLEVVMKSNECPYIVQFYGALFKETVKALNYLKEQLKIIHRDVKPSNILLDKRGNIKLCDFGISGHLVDSIARTKDAGCRPYMAPERIDPMKSRGYDVRSDVWSLGITLIEVATGHFPYPKWNSVFEQLAQVVQGEPPRLSPNENGNRFTADFVDFVNTCLIKEDNQRPKYNKLLEHPFIRHSDKASIDVADYVSHTLDAMANNGDTMFTTNQP